MTNPLPSFNALTASAKILPARRVYTPKYDRWQDEAWDYYDRIGELEFGVGWLASTMSRVRLLAAELAPGGNEPIPLDDGPAADAVKRLAGGTGGQAQLMREFTIHLSVPGEGWLVGERAGKNNETADHAANLLEEETWSIKSADELRVASKKYEGKNTYEVQEEQGAWRLISPDSLVVRCWNPHPRFGWQADSAVRHALGALLELDLINKRIIAVILSRLASNGILLYDKGKLSFPQQSPPEDGSEPPDPFAEMLVAVASDGIKDPTSPSATIPIPIGFDLANAADVDPKVLLQHITFDSPIEQKLLEERDAAVRKLATSLDMPAEVLLGLGEVNHWTAWQIEESGIKIHVAPIAELICYSLTQGYLLPMLKAMGADLRGPNGGRLVVWYDPSEITTRPDKSTNVQAAYDRFEASGEALRREIGLTEDDKPEGQELLIQVLKKLAASGIQLTGDSLDTLIGQRVDIEDTAPAASGTGEEPEDVENERTAPDTAGDEPPSPDEDMPMAAAALLRDDIILDDLDDATVASLFTRLQNDIQRRFGEPDVSPWVAAHEMPDPERNRVTPRRRNGDKSELQDTTTVG